MKKEVKNAIPFFESGCTNWHVAEIQLKYQEITPKKYTLRSISDAVNLVLNSVDTDELGIQEHMYAIFLNRKNDVIGFKTISVGTISSCQISPQLLFSCGILLNAGSFILLHNHPSGNLDPSPADILLTKQFLAVGNLLNIHLLDHIIIGINNYSSLTKYVDFNQKNEIFDGKPEYPTLKVGNYKKTG